MAKARARKPSTHRDRVLALLASTPGRWLTRGLVAAALLLVTALVVRQARARAWQLPAYRLGPASVRYVDLPPVVGGLLRRSLHDPRWLHFNVSVFDVDAEDVIRDVVSRHPMIASVRSVEVRYPDEVWLRVVVREPAAWFEVPSASGQREYVLVSWDGRLLDAGSYAHYRRRLQVPLPRVHGVRARRPRLAGQAWDDLPEQVAEGVSAARVAARIHRDFDRSLYVQDIDVSRFPAPPRRRRSGEVRLVLHDGTVVEWGRTERDRQGVAGEDPYEVKRWRLETELNRRGPRRDKRIDVRFRLPGEGRRPLTGR